jgi:hypothetical protein
VIGKSLRALLIFSASVAVSFVGIDLLIEGGAYLSLARVEEWLRRSLLANRKSEIGNLKSKMFHVALSNRTASFSSSRKVGSAD